MGLLFPQVRSNHDRLVRLSSDDCAEKDYPLQLETTSQWQEKGAVRAAHNWL